MQLTSSNRGLESLSVAGGAANETAAAHFPFSSFSSPSPPSLWSLIAPFDSTAAQLPFCRLHLWPLLSDREAVQASVVSRATLRCFSLIPIRDVTFWHTARAIHQQSAQLWKDRPAFPLRNVHCWPAVTRLQWETAWDELTPFLSRLPLLQHLTLHKFPCVVSSCIDGLLPRSLLSLSVCYDYSPLSAITFPSNLTELRLESSAEPPCRPSLLPGSLPPSLVSFYYDVAEDIPCGVLPSSLRLLHVATRRREIVGLTRGCLPAGLTELCWDGRIGAGLVAGLLPTSLRVLKLQDFTFDGCLDGVFSPDSQLESLSFGGGGFVQPFQSDTLPRSLTDLDLSSASRWNHSLDSVLPPSLRVLRLSERFFQSLTAATFATCPQLQTLDMSTVDREHSPIAIGALPPSLTDLRYPRGWVSKMPLVGSLPASLKRLDMTVTEPLTPGLLPGGLEQMTVLYPRHPIAAGVLPHSLREFSLTSGEFDHSLEGVFAVDSPLRLLALDCKAWKGPLAPHMLPAGLTELSLQYTSFNSFIAPHALPPALCILRLPDCYVQPFSVDSFAGCQKLEELWVPAKAFKQSLTAGLLPASLRRLKLHRKYDVRKLQLPGSVEVKLFCLAEGGGGQR